MQVKRIKKIINIGTFANFNDGAKFEFDKLIIFKGLNTYGKTTIVNILQSLKNDDSQYILDYKTIPNNNLTQEVEISYKENDNQPEKKLKFNGNMWEKNSLKDNLEIFGANFIYKNIFTGLKVERENKENFTDFVLGDKGVKFANQIKENKKKLREKNEKLKNILPLDINNLSEEKLEEFLNIDISKIDKNELNNEIDELHSKIKKEINNLEKTNLILELPEVNTINHNYNVEKILEKINDILKKNFNTIQQVALEKVKNHINNTFKNEYKNESDSWLRKGLEYTNNLNNGNCPFCGQNLGNAQDLIQAYNNYFNEEYKSYINEIEKELDKCFKEIKAINFNKSNEINKILLNINKYKDYFTDKSFIKKINDIENLRKDLENKENLLDNIHKKLLSLLNEKIEMKKRKPYISLENVNFNDYKSQIDKYIQIIEDINSKLNEIKKELGNFKSRYENVENINENISKLEEKKNKKEQILLRINNNEKIKEYNFEKDEIEKLKNQIEEDKKSLREDQENYLNTYFEKIDKLFNKFGSFDFTLEKNEERRGDKPVVFLKVKFHDQEIQYNNLEKVFSESDRRALGLAIFFAKLESLDNDELKKKIIVLDDPITSFDNNRIRNFIDYIKNLYDKVGQILIFTHYDLFINSFCKITNSKPKIIEINKERRKNILTSCFKKFNLDYFLKSDYLKALEEIQKFINNELDNYEMAKARVFLEYHYYPIFKDIVKDEMYKKYYSELCTDNHNQLPSNNEDKRNYLKILLEELYNFEYKNK